MFIKFYPGKFLQLLGCFMIVAGVSEMINSILGTGVALILMAIFFTEYYQKKETK